MLVFMLYPTLLHVTLCIWYMNEYMYIRIMINIYHYVNCTSMCLFTHSYIEYKESLKIIRWYVIEIFKWSFLTLLSVKRRRIRSDSLASTFRECRPIKLLRRSSAFELCSIFKNTLNRVRSVLEIDSGYLVQYNFRKNCLFKRKWKHLQPSRKLYLFNLKVNFHFY